MLRVIHQERLQEVTWGAFLQVGPRNMQFGKYQERLGLTPRTKPDKSTTAVEHELEVLKTRQKLGGLYRAPIKA